MRKCGRTWKKKFPSFERSFFFAFLLPVAFLCSPPAVPGEVQVTLAKSKVSSVPARPDGQRRGIHAAFVVSKNKRTRLRRALLRETWSEWVTRLTPRRTRNSGIRRAEWAGHACRIPKTRCDRTWVTVKWGGGKTIQRWAHSPGLRIRTNVACAIQVLHLIFP